MDAARTCHHTYHEHRRVGGFDAEELALDIATAKKSSDDAGRYPRDND